MKRCLACEAPFEAADWTCPNCGYQPALRDEIYQFTEGPPDAHAGFKPEYFARLGEIEESNFWFRARNELIQWALHNYFPDAKSFFEIGCGTGFVLAGIHEKFPRMRLAGSEIFADGLAIAKARVPKVDLYQMDARRISFEREFDIVGAFDVLEHVIEDENVPGTNVQCSSTWRRTAGDCATTSFSLERQRPVCDASTPLQPRRIAHKSRERWLPDRANHFF